jgi:hypothetical protein
MALPLNGITVVELGTSVAGPFAGQILGDLGARIIKIENPGAGDDARGWGPPFWHGASATFQALNRNKHSVGLDLKDEAQSAALRSFIRSEADVVLQNLRPGLVRRFGLDDRLIAENPRLIYCNLGSFGDRGPLRDQPGYDPLMQAFEDVALDAKGTRCIVLTGSGEKAFCAGGDLKERNGMTDEAWQLQHVLFERAFRSLLGCPVPVIAAVNGAAYGGGCEIAACCDFIYAAEHARFALTEVSLGILPGGGGTQTIPRAVGERRAKEIILTAQPFTAAQAADWGLVNRVVPGPDLDPGGPCGRGPHRRQRSHLRAPGQAVDPSRPADVDLGRPDVGDRSL